jgi:hypothetical protein
MGWKWAQNGMVYEGTNITYIGLFFACSFKTLQMILPKVQLSRAGLSAPDAFSERQSQDFLHMIGKEGKKKSECVV